MNAIKAFRIQKDFTGQELAKAVKVHPSYISQIEAGYTVSARLGKLIARRLGVDFEDIWEETERGGRYRGKNVKISVVKK